MKIEITSIEDIRQLLGTDQTHSIEIGQPYLIQTCTLYFTGRVVKVTATDLVLDDAAWIPNTGRLMDALKDGSLEEVEPHPACQGTIISRAAIVCMVRWGHSLPRLQK